MSSYDAVLVPGGGVRDGEHLPPWVERRLDLAARVAEGAWVIPLSAGTPHRPPPLDAGGFPIFESAAATRYLLRLGVAPERILIETHSYDTIGNAYFSRALHVDPARMRRLLVVTSEFHLPRTQRVFEWIYGLTPRTSAYELEYQGVSDEGMDPAILAARQGKEAEALELVNGLAQRLTTMREFHRWLFTHHKAYHSTREAFTQTTLGDEVLRSY